MAKLTLTDLGSEDNVVSPINANWDLIETALENTLSRDGTSPNSMEADLDMNGQQILNLPAATQDTEPVRKAELDALITVSLGINGGDVVGPAGATASSLVVFDGTTGKLTTDSTLLAATDAIHNEDSTSSTVLAGGSTSLLGGMVVLRGETHATEASDVIFRSDNSNRLRWDESASRWDFTGGSSLFTVSAIQRGVQNSNLFIGADTQSTTGANIVLYGSTEATTPDDILLRVGASTKLHWDDSLSVWDFSSTDLVDVDSLQLSGNRLILVDASNDSLDIFGDTAVETGGGIKLYGDSHASKAGDIEFFSTADVRLEWDESESNWDFGQTNIVDIQDLTATNMVTAGALRFGASTEKTIVSGAIDATDLSYVRVDTEADAASDNLDTINGGVDGQILVVVPENNGRTVILTDNTGNLRLNANTSLDFLEDCVTLIYDATNSYWRQLAFSTNA